MTFDQMVAAFGGVGRLSSELGVVRTAITNWRRRKIPPAQWGAIVDAAARLGIDGVTYDTLRRLSYPAQVRQVAA